MSMGETVSADRRARHGLGRRPAIDREHLRQQTLGNAELERSVLRLFARQAGDCVTRIRAAETLDARAEAAHLLLGSARGVGAFSVAHVAAEIERSKGPVAGRLLALDRAVEEARLAIADLLDE